MSKTFKSDETASAVKLFEKSCGKYKYIECLRKNGPLGLKYKAKGGIDQEYYTIDICKSIDRETLQSDMKALRELTMTPKIFTLFRFCEIFNDNDGFSYFIAPREDADELYHFIDDLREQEIKLTPEEVGEYVAQLANGLTYLHGKNILHGYLNSTDIYHYSYGLLKIGGFYNFEILKGPDSVSNLERTLFFKCPEEKIGLKYDNWCLGWILYELYTLQHQRLNLEKADFKKFKHPPLPMNLDQITKNQSTDPSIISYAETLKNTYKNLTMLEPANRHEIWQIIDDIHNNNTFLYKQHSHFKTSVIFKLKKIGQVETFSSADKSSANKSYTLRFESVLGVGQFGSAYKVTNLADNTKKALKSVDINKMANMLPEKTNTIVYTEVLALKRLKDRHPNIVNMDDYFISNGYLHLLLEFCDGGSLERHISKLKIDKKRFSKATIIDWSGQIFSALAFVHSENVIHRDMKPGNIILTSGPNNSVILKLIDFNISRNLDFEHGSRASTKLGTVGYMAPEIIENKVKKGNKDGDDTIKVQKGYDFRVDVWSSACIVYEMAYLKMAYEIKTFKTQADMETCIITKPPNFRAPMQIDPANGGEEFNLVSLFEKTFVNKFKNRATSQEALQILKSKYGYVELLANQKIT